MRVLKMLMAVEVVAMVVIMMLMMMTVMMMILLRQMIKGDFFFRSPAISLGFTTFG